MRSRIQALWKRSRGRRQGEFDHPDNWIFGPKHSVRELTEKRPPVLRIALVVAAALIVPAVSAVALVGSGGGVAGAGVPEGTDLTPSRSIRVTEDGAVVDALDVTGTIYVVADDVTVRRTRVTTTGYHAIRLGSGHTGLTVEDSTLECTTDRGRSGVAWNNYTAQRVEVGADCRRGFVVNDGTTITDSYWGGDPFPDVNGEPADPTPPPSTTAPPTTAPPSTTAPPTTAPPSTTAPPTTAPPPPANGAPVADGCQNETVSASGVTSAANDTSVRSQWPTDATTGPEVAGYNENALPRSGVNGAWRITEDGTVIDGKFHHGIVEVNADNVTIRNSVVCGAGPHIVRNNGQNLVIENSIIRGERGGGVDDPETGTPCQAAVAFGNYTIRSSEITYCNDGVKIANVVEIHDSWFHDMYTNRFGNGAGTHNDTVQLADSALPRFIFQGNSAYQDPCTSNRHFQLAPIAGPKTVGVLRIVANFFYGINGFNLDRGLSVSDGLIGSNTFAGSANTGPFHGLLYTGDGMDSVTRSANVYESSESANANPGSGYQCVAG
jgi:hypothetical protein